MFCSMFVKCLLLLFSLRSLMGTLSRFLVLLVLPLYLNFFTVLVFSLFWPRFPWSFRMFLWSDYSLIFLLKASLSFTSVSVILAFFRSSCTFFCKFVVALRFFTQPISLLVSRCSGILLWNFLFFRDICFYVGVFSCRFCGL